MSNPYIEAQREWDERFAFHAKQAKIAMIAACALVAVCLALGAVIVWQSMHRQYIPYLVMVDDLGRAEVTNPPQVLRDWPEAVVLREVNDIVERLRSIPSDQTVLAADWRKLVLFTLPGTAGYQKLSERGQSKVLSPFILQEQITIEVDVRSVLYQGGSTWIAEWSETTRDRTSGTIIEVKRFQGSFQLSQLGNLQPEVLTINPLGIMLQDFDIRLLGAE